MKDSGLFCGFFFYHNLILRYFCCRPSFSLKPSTYCIESALKAPHYQFPEEHEDYHSVYIIQSGKRSQRICAAAWIYCYSVEFVRGYVYSVAGYLQPVDKSHHLLYHHLVLSTIMHRICDEEWKRSRINYVGQQRDKKRWERVRVYPMYFPSHGYISWIWALVQQNFSKKINSECLGLNMKKHGNSRPLSSVFYPGG